MYMHVYICTHFPSQWDTILQKHTFIPLLQVLSPFTTKKKKTPQKTKPKQKPPKKLKSGGLFWFS